MTAETLDLETPHGPARAHVSHADQPRLALILGHGAGGGVQAPDLQAAQQAALETGASVALVEQPYRVAGKKSPPRAPKLDVAWTAVLATLRADTFGDIPLATGGRSSGARVACRTATQVGAHAVVCLAFPLVAPSGVSRQDELDGVDVPVLVVQGRTDRFGMPEPAEHREVVQVEGDHALRKGTRAIGETVADWLSARS